MKKIIRSNAVETSSQRGNLGKKHYDLHPRQVAIDESLVLSARVILSAIRKRSDIAINKTGNRSTSFQTQALSALLYLVWLSNLDFWLTAMVWVCTGKIAQVSHTQGKKITALMSQTHSTAQTFGAIIARAEQAAQGVLALEVSIFKLLPNIQKTTYLTAKIAKTKTRLYSIQMQRKQQRSFRYSSDNWKLREPLRTGKLSGCAC
ncbi:hypothetical protein [Anabaena lutea]|uniref:Transposase n=1 Tax=Anabaena lutea FACHB-196 TaxID=2692881 RepID=A0ABR8FFU2_9NOST|nr:hypothetical protein [Anabaena lutea]MBD2569023.1 hypothetical protein [Anabaena lutea FACHB-196]